MNLLNSHVLHAGVLFVSICKLVIGIKYIDEYSDIRSLKTSIRCSPNIKCNVRYVMQLYQIY